MNTAMQGPRTTHPEPVKVVSNNDSNRCQYRYSNGKRCRLSGSMPHFGLCSHHFSLSNPGAYQQSFSDSEDLSADLLPELSEFSAGTDIRQFLGRLLTLVTRGRISPRRASVLAYITNQLLHSHRAIILESEPAKDEPQQWIFDLPRPERDWPGPEPAPPSHHAPPSHPDMSYRHPDPEAPSPKVPS
jgi:hypothetical protein